MRHTGGSRPSGVGLTITICGASRLSPSDPMPRSLRFFYFSYQYPHNAYLLARVKTVAWREGVALRLHDISIEKEACVEHCIFSPTMLIVNDKYRW